ncbi:hypothetical protein IFO70_11165 [Phormidium tenue FACHB-886]|nr:hypothetical protein [Phormidium tenue FACHB-886]
MKTVYQSSVTTQGQPTDSAFPKWVSSMGLEWLYKLLLKIEALGKK